jgi:hypothetical protein
MAHIVQDHGGTVDKFTGDAIVVDFGDPQSKGVKAEAAMTLKDAPSKLLYRLHWGLAELASRKFVDGCQRSDVFARTSKERPGDIFSPKVRRLRGHH